MLKGVTKTIKNETKEQKGGFLSKLLGTLGASLLGDLLSGKGIVRAGSGNKKEKGVVKAGYGNFVIEVKLFISIVLVLNIFLKKLKNLSGKKI